MESGELRGKMRKRVTGESERLPGWVVCWFFITGVVCTWDASFIILRPHTLPGGKYSALWDPYKYYVTVDRRYNDLNDDFVFCQSLLNYVEVALNFATLFLHYQRSRGTSLLGFTVSVMTLWKTVLYFLMFVWGDRQGNTWMEEVLLVVIPNGIWIFFPFLVIIFLAPRLTPSHSHTVDSSRDKRD